MLVTVSKASIAKGVRGCSLLSFPFTAGKPENIWYVRDVFVNCELLSMQVQHAGTCVVCGGPIVSCHCKRL